MSTCNIFFAKLFNRSETVISFLQNSETIKFSNVTGCLLYAKQNRCQCYRCSSYRWILFLVWQGAHKDLKYHSFAFTIFDWLYMYLFTLTNIDLYFNTCYRWVYQNKPKFRPKKHRKCCTSYTRSLCIMIKFCTLVHTIST